jgi:hypothetical protein
MYYNGTIQLVLSEDSREKLLEVVPPEHETVYAHHVTVAYKPQLNSPIFSQYEEGTEVVIEAIAYACDDRGQAVIVRGVSSAMLRPHVTISCEEYTKPSYSNHLLNEPTSHMEPLKLTGVIEFKHF